jgi:hypothetical protein
MKYLGYALLLIGVYYAVRWYASGKIVDSAIAAFAAQPVSSDVLSAIPLKQAPDIFWTGLGVG